MSSSSSDTQRLLDCFPLHIGERRNLLENKSLRRLLPPSPLLCKQSRLLLADNSGVHFVIRCFQIALRKTRSIRDGFLMHGVGQTLSMRTSLKRNMTVTSLICRPFHMRMWFVSFIAGVLVAALGHDRHDVHHRHVPGGRICASSHMWSVAPLKN